MDELKPATAYTGWLESVRVCVQQMMYSGGFRSYTISTWNYPTEADADADDRGSFVEVPNPAAVGGNYEIVRRGRLGFLVSAGTLPTDADGFLPFETQLLSNPGSLIRERTKIPVTWPLPGGGACRLAESEVRRHLLARAHGSAV